MKKTVAIGSDHAGFALKQFLIEHLSSQGFDILDLGPENAQSVDYPDFAKKTCREVLEKNIPGILICGTGIGMSMTANHIPGIRAAICDNEYLARMTRKHNDANVLCMGERVVGQGLAASVADVFLDTEFEGGRHKRRVDMIETAC
jgi:ribose 5-phosphate isomerase B